LPKPLSLQLQLIIEKGSTILKWAARKVDNIGRSFVWKDDDMIWRVVATPSTIGSR
jgi:hypothetical protein